MTNQDKRSIVSVAKSISTSSHAITYGKEKPDWGIFISLQGGWKLGRKFWWCECSWVQVEYWNGYDMLHCLHIKKCYWFKGVHCKASQGSIQWISFRNMHLWWCTGKGLDTTSEGAPCPLVPSNGAKWGIFVAKWDIISDNGFKVCTFTYLCKWNEKMSHFSFFASSSYYRQNYQFSCHLSFLII